MFAHVTRLQYCKSDHDIQSCEDALGIRLSDGVLAVTDGMGTTLFSNLWSRHLVNHFLDVPVLSDDPFEVEWWLRLAQEGYLQRLPAMEGMPWHLIQKVHNEGNFSTLAAICVTHSSENSVSAQLLAFGNSCIFVKKKQFEHIIAFPFTSVNDFELPLISLPSKLNFFNRYIQRARLTHVALAPGDIVVLATDTLAQWLLGAGKGQRGSRSAALSALIEQTPATWVNFVRECQTHGEIVDDDCSALILRISAVPEQGAERLGYCSEHTESVRSQRKQDFLRAVAQQNKELAALYFGDGVDLELEGIIFPREQLRYARQVADALREMLQALRRTVKQQDAAVQLSLLWHRYAPLLLTEPCAVALRNTLFRLGVKLDPPQIRVSGEMASISPRQIAQRKNSELRVAFKSQEQLDLELQLRRALFSDEDSAIVTAYDQVRLSPYALEITSSQRNDERIQVALRRETLRRRIQGALASKNIEQIVSTFTSLAQETIQLSSEEESVVQLAQRFLAAYRTNDDQQLIAIADELQHAPMYEALHLTLTEEERVALARRRLWQAHDQAHTKPMSVSSSFVGHVPVIGEYWFHKACEVKKAYLFHWALRKPSQTKLEQETLDDLVNAPLIKQGIDAANKGGVQPPLLPEMLLPDIFEAFRGDHMVNYVTLVRENVLTDDDVKQLLLIFLNRQLFEEYLLWDKAVQLQDWLQEQHGSDSTLFRRNLEMACPWVKKLSWWEG